MKLLFLVSLLLSGVFAHANRITPANIMRCNAMQLSPALCEQQRQFARGNGCITEEEYQTLARLGGMPSCMYGTNTLAGWCTCGCFAADTLLKIDANQLSAASSSVKSIVLAHAAGERPELAHLSSSATLGSLDFKNSPVRNVSVGVEKAPLFVIRTSAGSISLTANHPAVLADGSIRRTEKLRIGDALLGYDGQARKILAIERRSTSAKVYNVNVDTDQDGEHLIVANGFLMGDLYLQGSLHYFENQLLIRQ